MVENIDVRQRNMSDAVGIGLTSGVVASAFIILGGLAIASKREVLPTGDLGEYSYTFFTYGLGLYTWMVIMTSLLVGIFVYVKFISDYFRNLPKQSNTTATVT